jgi:prophage tail gpP-like protein
LVILQVAGAEYSGFTRARVTRSLESLAGSFEAETFQRTNVVADFPILPEDECVVKLRRGPGKDPIATPVITGYVEHRNNRFSVEGRSVTISGRDQTAQLIDCSVQPPWFYSGTGILEVCQYIAKPFDISVSLQPSVKDAAVSSGAPVKGSGISEGAGSIGKMRLQIGHPAVDTAIHPGESAFEAIDRFCRSVGVLAMSDGQGGLLLTRAGEARCQVPLEEGLNILSGSVDYDGTRRYAKYIVLSQLAGAGTQAGIPDVRGVASDEGVRRKERVLYIPDEEGHDESFAIARAMWESRVRAGRSAVVSVTVHGWTQHDRAETLWPINARVFIRSPSLGIADELIITEATYSYSLEGGTTTELRLMYPAALLAEVTARKVKGSTINEFVAGL